MLSVRELNSNTLQNRSWINERLTFTHGYGLTLGPVNQVTTEGLPVLFIRNLPPESTVDLRLTSRAIYFGELSSDHVFVKTNTREFHYPKGDDNIFSTYEGDGGVNVGTFARKALFSAAVRILEDPAERRHTAGEPRHLPPEHQQPAPEHHRAFPDIRRRPLPGDLRGTALLDPRRLHREQPLSVFEPRHQHGQLHPQLDQGGRSTPTTARPPSTWPIRTIRSRRPSARIFPDMLRPLEMPLTTCAATFATRRASSRCRRRCSRPTT
jgi:hypothetical protein